MIVNVALVVLTAAVVVLGVFAVPLLIQLRRTAKNAELTLTAVEREIRPLASQLHVLLQEGRDLIQRGNKELGELARFTATADELLARLGKVLGVLAGLGRVGQVVGVAQGVKKGVDVFVRRLGKRA